MQQYLDNLDNILSQGVEKFNEEGSGVGVGRISLFNVNTTYDISSTFPLQTIRRLNFDKIFTELAWMISGRTNIKELVMRGCDYWNYNAYDYYLQNLNATEDLKTIPEDHEKLTFKDFITSIKKKKFSELHFGEEPMAGQYRLGDLGGVYGQQLRQFNLELFGYTQGDDQFGHFLRHLENDPESSRHFVSMWNPISNKFSAIPPCHHSFQVYMTRFTEHEMEQVLKGATERIRRQLETEKDSVESKYLKDILEDIEGSKRPRIDICRELSLPCYYLDLKFHMRSNDYIMGAPSNIAFYALLSYLICSAIAIAVPNKLIHDVGDCHIYSNHVEGAKKLLKREPRPLPTLWVSPQINQVEYILNPDILMYKILDSSLYGTEEQKLVKLENYNPYKGIRFLFNGLNSSEVYE